MRRLRPDLPVLVGLAALLALPACSNWPLHQIQQVSINTEPEPFPADYKQIVRDSLGIKRAPGLMLSEPRSMLGATAFEPLRWYSCVRAPDGKESIFVLTGGAVAGRIAGPSPHYCDGGTYALLDG